MDLDTKYGMTPYVLFAYSRKNTARSAWNSNSTLNIAIIVVLIEMKKKHPAWSVNPTLVPSYNYQNRVAMITAINIV